MAMLQYFKSLIFRPGFLLLVYVVAAIIISVQLISLGHHDFVILHKANVPADITSKPEHGQQSVGHKANVPEDITSKPGYVQQFVGHKVTDYNNYLIFKSSFFHLKDKENLYGVYPSEHWDYYKYSPTFALFMGALAYLPDVAGLSIWNIINALAIFFAVRLLPFKPKAQALLLWFIANDLFCCFSNTQSNGIMAGLLVAAYCCMERDKSIWATLWLALATYIKVYGAIGFCLFLFYPGKVKFILYSLLWAVVLAALPLTITPLQTLVWQYHNWTALLMADASAAYGLSVAGWLHNWFGLDNIKTGVTIVGVVLFLLQLIKFKVYRDLVYRLLFLASMLIWVIIFNHKAESPTFIIAVTGVGIWFFAMPRAAWRTALLLFVLLFTSLSTTDIFPLPVRTAFIYPYGIKVFPCIVVWCVVYAELMALKPRLNAHRAESEIAA